MNTLNLQIWLMVFMPYWRLHIKDRYIGNLFDKPWCPHYETTIPCMKWRVVSPSLIFLAFVFDI